MKKKILVFLFVLFLFNLLFAVQTDIALSSRYNGMGNSGLALSDSIDVIFYNPAGISIDRGNKYDLIYSFNNRFGITGYFINSGAVLIPVMRVQNYNVQIGAGVKNEILKEIVTINNVFLTVASSVGYGISIGVSVHYVMQSFYDSSFQEQKFSYFDIGLIYKPMKIINFALVYNSFNFDSTYPYKNLKLGFSYILDKYGVIMNMDVKVLQDIYFYDGYRAIINAGLEKMIVDGLYFRVGVDNLNITLGIGFRFKRFYFDYSYSSILSGNQQISLKYNI